MKNSYLKEEHKFSCLPVELLFIAGVGAFFFLPFIGSIHLFDWDEINFAESAREMIVSGNYSRVMIDFEPFWEKPPLFFWLQVASMKLFGINEFSARFPNAIFGILTLSTLFLIGKRHYDSSFGYIWTFLYLGSFLPHLYFRSGIIDPVFNYFIFLSLYFLIRNITRNCLKDGLLSGVFIGLAILTKGPVGLLILFLTFLIYWSIQRFRRVSSVKSILVFTSAALCITGFWFGLEIIENGFWFISNFISYQINLLTQPVAGHGQPFYYHFIVIFIGCFPISVLALPTLFGKCHFSTDLEIERWMRYLFWVVMILFSVVTTKIVHYSSMAYLPLSFLAALHIQHLIHTNEKPLRWIIGFLFGLAGLWTLALTLLPLIPHFKYYIIPYIKDPFAVANLNTPVSWSGFEFLIGILYGIVAMWSIFLFKNKKIQKSLKVLTLSTAFCILVYTTFVVPKIEAYSQRSAIEFLKSISGKDIYIKTYGYKSYAPYFYSRVSEKRHPESKNEHWLMYGKIDKPVYFITKITHTEVLSKNKNFQKVYDKGGFVVFKRDMEH